MAFFGVLGLLWVIAAVRVLSGMAGVPRLAKTEPLTDFDCPSVSILVAARDEAARLPEALPTLLAQDYPRYEVIAVDDRSQDATPQILDEFCSRHENLKSIRLAELPRGWLGKSYALTVAHQHASAEWIALVDADVHLTPDVLRRSLALVKEKGWDHLSVIFLLDLKGFWEKTVLSWWLLSILLWLEPWRASDPKSRRFSGSGAFQLLRRSTYESVGTHRRLAMEVVEDIKLGKLVKQAGFGSGVAWSDELVRLRWHQGLCGIVEGLTKNTFAACNYRVSVVLCNLSLLVVFHLLPYFGLVFTRGWPTGLAAISVVVPVLLRAYTDRYYRVSPLYALTSPIGAVVFFYLLLHSTAVVLRQGGLRWRDTFYSLDELRKGLV